MRNIVVTIIIFLVMCFCLFFASQYIILTSDKLLDVANKMESNIVDENWDNAYILSFELLDIYEGHVKHMTIFINHANVDVIYSEVIKLTQYCKEEDKTESLATLHLIKTLLLEVKQLEKVSISNIFFIKYFPITNLFSTN
ncbi:hypothetical protein J2Z44_002075 [Clostridium punense]|uniref:DUF4363 family protein n=1 Tax=Clostridium punense TaxID=1054297 RepID=A0ABS4K3B0_9CLOT|nr:MULTISPECIES: DUF4363 family protein [Clostridium]EQB90079.1 hypothetical protein M918_02250 [Clostridium sp. BL8]MBP2022274.1 hypothetical protein [Clostridium punense]